jgi:endoglucanase
VTERLVQLAQKHNILYQQVVFGRSTGTDADVLAVTAGGVPTGLLSIPVRYMHHPLETVALSDIEETVRLLLAFVREASHV